jgi:uncharacterized membrane protein
LPVNREFAVLRRIGFTMLSAALALAGCQPKAAEDAPQAPATTPPTVRTSDFSQPMTARGNEPFWALKIEGGQFTLARPDRPDAVYEAPGARIAPGTAEWTAKGPGGRTLKVTLYMSPCSDGMSDLEYPMTAEVELATDGEVLRGCAAKTAELPRAGG